ncbi:MAG: transposase [Saprospiraceae bacterium]
MWKQADLYLLIGEIGDMSRFKNLDHMAGYCGLVPDERSSGRRHVSWG